MPAKGTGHFVGIEAVLALIGGMARKSCVGAFELPQGNQLIFSVNCDKINY